MVEQLRVVEPADELDPGLEAEPSALGQQLVARLALAGDHRTNAPAAGCASASSSRSKRLSGVSRDTANR